MKKYGQQAGFTITELLVAILISLIGSIIIFQVLTQSNLITNSVTSGSSSIQNGAIALYTLERDARSAGYGENSPELLGCNLLGENTPAALALSFTMGPVVISKGSGTPATPDSITINYASQSDVLPGILTASFDGAEGSALHVNNRFGFNLGDVAVLAQAGSPCALLQVTALPTGGSADQIEHSSGTYTDAAAVAQTALYNKSGGLMSAGALIPYALGASLFNLGPQPVSRTYSIDTTTNKLMVRDNFTGSAAVSVSQGIVQLRAQYGSVASGVVTFSNTTPSTLAQWRALSSLRVALVSRASIPDPRRDAAGACMTTTSAPTWAGGAIDVSASAPAGVDWKCFRYKVFETTVFLKNMLWSPL
jgi:type IV pilus assembly protein PilW